MTKSQQQINFLTSIQPAKWERLHFDRVKWILTSLVVVLVLIGLLLSAINWIKHSQLAAVKRIHHEKLAELASKDAEMIKARGAFVGELPEKFFLSRMGFYELLYGLSRQDHRDVWLSQFSYNYSDQMVRMSGYGNNPGEIQQFIASLKQNKALKSAAFSLFVLDVVAEGSQQDKKEDGSPQPVITRFEKGGKWIVKTDHGSWARFESAIDFDNRARQKQLSRLGVSGNLAREQKSMDFDRFYQELLNEAKASEAPYVFGVQADLLEVEKTP